MSTNKTSPQEGSNAVKNVTGSQVVIGHHITATANIHFEQFKDSNEKNDKKLWEDITTKMDDLLKAVKALSDEHGELRDIELIPAVGIAKKEATAIVADPQKSKQSFIDKFKNICDLSGKVIEVGGKLAPFVTTIGKLLGIA